MPRTERVNQAIREERKAAILAAAARVFAQQGYIATRVSDIADTAQISHGLLYHYFSGKDEVFSALVERAAAGVIHLLQAANELPVPPAQRLRWLMEQEAAGLSEDPHIFMVVLQAMMSDAVPAKARSVAKALVATTPDLLRQMVAEGQRAGQVVEGDPEEIGLLIGILLQGIAVGAAIAPEALPRAESLTQLFLLARD